MDTDSSSEGEDQVPVRIPLGHRPVLFSVPGSRKLVANIVAQTGWAQGLCNFEVYDNGEINAKVEETVTNHDVFLLCARDDAGAEINFSLMQLMLFVSALKGEAPYRLTVVLPCLEYARQDRVMQAGQGIPAQLLLRCLRTAGADRFLTVDLHNEAQVAFAPSSTVLDELCARRYLAHVVRSSLGSLERTVVCATRGGGLSMTRRMAAELCCGFMMVDRVRPKAGGRGELKIMSSEPADAVDAVVVVDDIFDTCGSLAEVCRAVHSFVPRAKLYGVASHGYFSAEAQSLIKDLVDECGLEWVAVTNSVSQTSTVQRFESIGLHGRLRVVDISKLLAGAVMRIYLGASVNQPKYQEIGPADYDPVLQGLNSPRVGLARRTTDPPVPQPPLAI